VRATVITALIHYKNPDADQMTPTTKLAYRYGLTAYDSVYLACAEVADTSLVTADKRFYDKAREYKRVMLLFGYGKVA
jgi:predicted nucleic acid-binding protein